jgi:hypothetical protein
MAIYTVNLKLGAPAAILGLSADSADLYVEGGQRLSVPSTKIWQIFLVTVSAQQVGSTFTLDSGPIFAQTADYLTSGSGGGLFDNGGYIAFELNPAYGPGQYVHVPNLQGSTIYGFDLTLDDFNIDPVQVVLDPKTGEYKQYPLVHASVTFVIRGLPRREPPPPEGPSPPGGRREPPPPEGPSPPVDSTLWPLPPR